MATTRAGTALELLIHGLYQNYREGIVTRGLPSHNLAVTMTKTSLGTPEAKVTGCSDDSGAVAYSKSGKTVQGRSQDGRRSTPRCSRSTAPGRSLPGRREDRVMLTRALACVLAAGRLQAA